MPWQSGVSFGRPDALIRRPPRCSPTPGRDRLRFGQLDVCLEVRRLEQEAFLDSRSFRSHFGRRISLLASRVWPSQSRRIPPPPSSTATGSADWKNIGIWNSCRTAGCGAPCPRTCCGWFRALSSPGFRSANFLCNADVFRDACVAAGNIAYRLIWWCVLRLAVGLLWRLARGGVRQILTDLM